MRLMLDAHVSGPRVGRALEEMGHDVRAVDQEKDIERLPDEQLFELAVSDGRVLVTHNGKISCVSSRSVRRRKVTRASS